MVYVLCAILWIIGGWIANYMCLNELKRVIGNRVEECSGKEADYDKIEDAYLVMSIDNSGIFDFEKKRYSIPNTILSFVYGVLLWPISLIISLVTIHKYKDELGQDMSEYAQRNE